MQKYLFLFLVISGEIYGMDVQSNKPVTIIIAAWATTPETLLDEQSEVRIWQLPGGRTMSYTSRPKGVWEKRIEIKSMLEFTPSETSTEYSLLLSCLQGEMAVTQIEKPWYKHSMATHGAAIVSTILLMRALFG